MEGCEDHRKRCKLFTVPLLRVYCIFFIQYYDSLLLSIIYKVFLATHICLNT